MSLDDVAIEENRKQHIKLGIRKGLSLGILTTMTLGPEIADFVTTIAQYGINSEYLDIYKHFLDVAQNLESTVDRYIVSRVTSLPVVAGVTTAIGFTDGIYNTIKGKLGYTQPQKIEGNTLIGRYIRAGFVAREYELKEEMGRNQAYYLATRDVCTRVISQIVGIDDKIKIKGALDLITDEETRFKEYEDEETLIRAKRDVIHQITDYAAHPNTYTFLDRLSVTGIEKDLAALSAPFWTTYFTYTYTQSVLKTLAAGFASTIAGFVASVYVDSAINCQLLSKELKKRKEESKILYQNFLAKVNSM